MFQRYLRFLGATFGLLVLSATPALASVFTANATTTCSTYSLALSASDLAPGAQYTLSFSIDVSPGSSGLPVSGYIPFTAPDSGTFTDTVTGSFPALTGTFTFYGTATLTPSDLQRRPLGHKHQLLSLNAYMHSASATPMFGPVDQRLEF